MAKKSVASVVAERGLVVKEKTELADTNQSLFGTNDYSKIIEKAKTIATSVGNIVQEQKLFTAIQGKKYVHCEGWTTMGELLGLFPQIIEVREEKSEKGIKYIADCEVRTVKGDLISRAQSECASYEKNKVRYDEYALRSMAETRAVSKAFRISLSWIMVLGGYQPTPAEEMTAEIIEADPKPGKVKIDDAVITTKPEATVRIKGKNKEVNNWLDTPSKKYTPEEKLENIQEAITNQANKLQLGDKRLNQVAEGIAKGNWGDWTDLNVLELLYNELLRMEIARGKK